MVTINERITLRKESLSTLIRPLMLFMLTYAGRKAGIRICTSSANKERRIYASTMEAACKMA